MGSSSEFSVDEMFGWVEQQARMGARRAGSPAGHQNEDFLEDRLRAFGLEAVRKEPIPIIRWEAEQTSFAAGQGGDLRPIEAFPIPYSAFTPDGGIDAPLIWLDPRKLRVSGDLSGKIVVTEIGFPPMDLKVLSRVSLGRYDPDDNLFDVDHPATFVRLGWHMYRESIRRGAAGFIGILRDQPGGSCRMYAPYGFREADILDKPLPGCWVGKGDGDALAAAARSGRGRGRLEVRGIREAGVTHNVVGEVPGSSGEATVLSCHHDSPFESPVEDASGVSVVLALARHFARRRDLDRRLIVLLSAGHFYGSIGTRTFIRDHRLDVVQDTAVEISIEHISLEAAEDAAGALVPTGLPESTGIFVPLNRAVADVVVDGMKAHDVRRVLLLPAEGPFGDYPPTDGGDWWEAGVPVVNYICNPVYLLTDDDAMKWVDRARLPGVAGAFADIIRALDRLPRRDISAVDSRRYQMTMKLLKAVVRAKTTAFGLKPVY